jgi:hypothetical protein
MNENVIVGLFMDEKMASHYNVLCPIYKTLSWVT